MDPASGERTGTPAIVRGGGSSTATPSDPEYESGELEYKTQECRTQGRLPYAIYITQQLTWWFDLEPESASNGRPDDLKNMKIVFLHWLLHDSSLTNEEKASTLAESADPALLKEAFAKAESVEGLFEDAMFLYGTHRPIRNDLDLLRPPVPELNFEVVLGTPLSAFNLSPVRPLRAPSKPQLSGSAVRRSQKH